MVTQQILKPIFLSASVPLPNRNAKYFDTADVVAIRDSVRALASTVIPKTHLVWGGHPAITPLIRYVLDRMNAPLRRHVTLYQSNFFRSFFPDDNFAFEDVKIIQGSVDRESSLREMRTRMILDHRFVAGFFIGGMEGVEDEFDYFRRAHPHALIFPIASTGAAARILYDRMESNTDKRLLDDYAYLALFKSLLKTILGE